MTAGIPEKGSTWLVDWGIVTLMATRCRLEIPTTMMMPRSKTATPNRTRISSRRSSENPTNSPPAPQLSPRKLTSPPSGRTLSGASLLEVLGLV
jgi:hypothetical protein